MKRLLLFVLALSVFGSAFSMDKKKDMGKFYSPARTNTPPEKMYVIRTNVPDSEEKIFVYMKPEIYKKAKKDSRFKDQPEATLTDVDPCTVFAEIPITLEDTKEKVVVNVKLFEAEKMFPGIVAQFFKKYAGADLGKTKESEKKEKQKNK